MNQIKAVIQKVYRISFFSPVSLRIYEKYCLKNPQTILLPLVLRSNPNLSNKLIYRQPILKQLALAFTVNDFGKFEYKFGE